MTENPSADGRFPEAGVAGGRRLGVFHRSLGSLGPFAGTGRGVSRQQPDSRRLLKPRWCEAGLGPSPPRSPRPLPPSALPSSSSLPPSALTLPGFQQHRVGHDVLNLHGRGGSFPSGQPPSPPLLLLLLLLLPPPPAPPAPRRRSSGPAAPQRCARLFPIITRCSARHRPPPPRGRRQGAGSARPPRP